MNRSPSFGTRARQVILPVLFLLYTVPGMLAQDPYPARIKSALILNFSAAVEWENEEEIDTFHIGLYGTEKGLASEMKLMETVALKGKPIVVHQFSRLSEISGIQALYVAIDRNSEIRRIAEAITGKNILLITDQCRDDIHTMINLIPPDKEDRTRFLINKANMILEHLKALPELIVYGGSEVDFVELYREVQKNLQGANTQVQQLTDSLEKQSEEIRAGIELIDSQKKQIDEQGSRIAKQQEEIVGREKELAGLQAELNRFQRTVNKQIALINSQQKDITGQEEEIGRLNAVRDQRQQEIDEQQMRIEEQRSQLTEYATLLQRQKYVLFSIVIFCVLILGLIFFIYRGYQIKKRANMKLESMNQAIRKQNMEISQQKKEIEEKNEDLKKSQEEVMAQADDLKQANEEILSTNEALQNQKDELQHTLENLRLTQDQLIQSEKLASVGQLTAGIAHELNNPINFISGNVKPLKRDVDDIFTILQKYDAIIHEAGLQRYFGDLTALKEELDYKFLTDEIKSLLEGIGEGAQRSGEIVKGLRSFSRMDDDKFKMADIHDGIDSTLILLYNKTKNRISIHKDYGDVPEIECLPNKINQVIMNILNNSIQSIKDKGDVYIETISSGIGVKICIRDNGEGMTPEVKKRIFEPFFTTKEVGKGTGLGLSISYGIIEQHHGNIDVISEPGKGTEFIITLPISQPSNS